MNYVALKRGEAVPLQSICDTEKGAKSSLSVTLISDRDMADLVKMLDDPKVIEYLFFAPAPVEVYEAFFMPIITETQDAIRSGEWPRHPTVVVRDENDQFMGMAGLSQMMFLPGNYDMGYQLPAHAWQQGIATALCQLMTDIAFNEMAAYKVTGSCYGQNIASAKVLEKCGYVHEGRSVGYYPLRDGFDDRLYLGMTAEQYASAS